MTAEERITKLEAEIKACAIVMQKLTNSVSRLAEIMATCERSLQIQQGAILKIIGHINGAEGIEGIDAPTEVN